MKKILKYILVSSVILTPMIGSSKSVQAIGPNPAFKKEKVDISKKNEDILKSVHRELTGMLYVTKDVFNGTDLNKALEKNYADVGYPSKNSDTNEGFDADGNLDINALKKPMTEPSKIELADVTRFYKFYFTDGRTFKLLTQDTYSVIAYDQENLKSENKLNYFDYIKLIDSINKNPNYTDKIKQEKLTIIEADLQNSIDSLYGSLSVDKSNSLLGWGESKSLVIPFSTEKYSYLQLLAAYKKDDITNDTLTFYSSLIDALYEIKLYSSKTRQYGSAEIDTEPLVKNIQDSYDKLNKSLLKPVETILIEQDKASQALEKGDLWQKEQLDKLGINDKEEEL